MGIFDLFRRRGQREGAAQDLGLGAQPSQQAGSDLSQLGELGGFAHQAALEGKIEVDQGPPQESDLPDAGPREEIQQGDSGGGDSGGCDSGGGDSGGGGGD